MAAAEEWAEALASWVIPPEIMAKAPTDPWAWPVARRVCATEEALTLDSPSIRRAREAIPDGGSVLDVGCGAGAASMPLCPPAASVVGVDPEEQALAAFAEQAARRGVTHAEVAGNWPAVAGDVEAADVVVCNHVVYNIPDLGPFAAALTEHARRRVVLEMTSEHPRAWMNPLWKALHGVDRPMLPTVGDAVAVLAGIGIDVHVERWLRPTPMNEDPPEDLVLMIRQALCLMPEDEREIARALAEHPPPGEREHAALWWGAR